ncbi:MAG: transposase [Acidobacteria bacterium]|nr:transposase [Acidobacteriota bacterium]
MPKKRITEEQIIAAFAASRGRGVENAFIESFNGRLRDGRLNVEIFHDVADARERVEVWRLDAGEPGDGPSPASETDHRGGRDPTPHRMPSSIAKPSEAHPEEQRVERRDHAQREDGCEEQAEDDCYRHRLPHRAAPEPQRNQPADGGHRRQHDGP